MKISAPLDGTAFSVVVTAEAMNPSELKEQDWPIACPVDVDGSQSVKSTSTVVANMLVVAASSDVEAATGSVVGAGT